MQPKPTFLGQQTASAFQEESVVEAYQQRPPYPDAVFDILASLIVDQPRHVLDVGCGTGFLARRLVGRIAHIDAVDISPAMVERGKHLPGGDSPTLSWIVGSTEDAPLKPPYALITAGDSLHWMEWAVVLPRFAAMLTPNGCLAILGVGQTPTPWDDELLPVIQRYSTIAGYRPYDIVEELETRGLFQTTDRQSTAPVPFTQSLDAYIESFHGRASFSRERMGVPAATAFDAEVRALVSRYVPQEVTLQVMTEVVWGKPLRPGE
jgi:trans-aconitate methyltransferase